MILAVLFTCWRGFQTKKAHKPKIYEYALAAILLACKHQRDDQENGDAEIRLKLPSLDELPNLIGAKFWVVVIGGQYDRDNAAYSNQNAGQVPHAKGFFQHKGSDDTI